jgi:hypothetical protein
MRQERGSEEWIESVIVAVRAMIRARIVAMILQ